MIGQTGFMSGLDMWYKGKKGVKHLFQIFGYSNWKNRSSQRYNECKKIRVEREYLECNSGHFTIEISMRL